MDKWQVDYLLTEQGVITGFGLRPQDELDEIELGARVSDSFTHEELVSLYHGEEDRVWGHMVLMFGLVCQATTWRGLPLPEQWDIRDIAAQMDKMRREANGNHHDHGPGPREGHQSDDQAGDSRPLRGRGSRRRGRQPGEHHQAVAECPGRQDRHDLHGDEDMSMNIDLSAMFDRVTRFEVIDEDGVVLGYRDVIIQIHLQDDLRTLKIVVQKRNSLDFKPEYEEEK